MEDSEDEVFNLPKQVRLLEPADTDEEIMKMIISCSACDERFSFRKLNHFKKHIHLSVLVCKKCFEFYDDGNFSKDEMGDKYCRWCADGGRLIACDCCTNAFCVKCLRRNFGRNALSTITSKENWKCFVCDPTPLEPHINFCKRILKCVKSEKKKSEQEDLAINLATSDSEVELPRDEWKTNSWAGPLLVQAENAIVVLNRRMARVKRRLSRDSSNVNNYALKFKKLLSKHHQYIEYLLVDIKNGLEENENTRTDLNVNGILCDTSDQSKSPNHLTSISAGVSCSTPDQSKSEDHPSSNSAKDDEVECSRLGTPLQSENDLEATNPSITENLPEDHNTLDSSKPFQEEGGLADEMSDVKSDEVQKTSQLDVTIDSDNDNEALPNVSKVSEDLNCSLDMSVEEEKCSQQSTVAMSSVDESNNDSDSTSIPETESKLETNISNSNLKSVESGSENMDSHKTVEPSKRRKKKRKSQNDNANSSTNEEISGSVDISRQSGSENENATLKLEFSSSDSEDAGLNNVKNAVGDFLEQSAGNDDNDDENEASTLKQEKAKTKNRVKSRTDRKKEKPKDENDETGTLSDEENEKARRSLLSELPSSTKQKKRKRNLSLSSDTSLSDEDIIKGENKETIFPKMENDLKLRMHAVVIVERLNLPDTDVTEYSVKKEKDRKPKYKRKCREQSAERTLDDLISSLSNIPKEKPKVSTKSTTAKTDSSDSSNEFENTKLKRKTTPKKKAKSAMFLSSDSSDDMEAEDSLKHKLEPKVEMESKSVNTMAKNSLLIDSSNSSSSDSDVKVVRKKLPKVQSKSSATASKVFDSDSDSSSSDFVNRKKYSKYDKLLKVPLGKNKKNGRAQRNKEKDDAEKNKKLGKKIKKRNVISDSEKSRSSSSSSSSSDSSDSDSSDAPTPKKRKRIKSLSNSDSDVKEVTDTPTSKGRKNIRKLLDDRDLGKATKMASEAEKERRERVKARQKLYNQVTEEGGDFGETVTRKLVLEIDPNSKEELVEVASELISKLKPHQVNGVKFMWECLIESLSRLENEKEKGSGCVLAHCMGLGKTLQVITFLSTLLNNNRVNAKIKTALICCPLNTIRNWSREFDMWLGTSEYDVQVFEIVDVKNARARADVLEHWHESGGVMIMSYEQFRTFLSGKKVSKKCRTSFEKTLLNPGPDVVVCDEGHVLKNESSALSKAMSQIRTQRRVVLTGTPLQNNLDEYHCMIQFVKPLLLGTKKEFLNRFVNPIKNGQCADSNQRDVKVMKKRVHILHKLLEGCVQRCDYDHVTKYLPPKYEFVISVRLSEIQIRLYRMYLDRFSRNGSGGGDEDDDQPKKINGSSLFKDFAMLKLIWTHPFLLELQKKKADLKALFEDNSMDEFINDDSDSSKSAKSTSSSSSDTDKKDEVICLSDDAKPSTSKEKKKNRSDDSDVEEVVSNWKTRSRGNADNKSESEDEGPRNDQWWNEHITEEELTRIDLSGKMLLLFEILKQCELVGDKLLLFTQSLLSLDLIEELLHRQAEQHQTLSELEAGDAIGTWKNGVDYFRMDGSTSADHRKKYIQIFNDASNERARLFMISTKAGSLGTNLVGANRVIILDASWNPTHDVQAIFRVYRFGQKKPVYVYRLLAQGTMEEKIYDRQVTKQSMAFRVVDEQQIERHFNAADLVQLYSFEPDSKSNRPTPRVPKDMLLADMLIKEETRDWIVTYHEHDSLLENKVEEELTEDEKKFAWVEFEAQKEGLINDALYESPETQFLFEVLEEDNTGNLRQIVDLIKEKRPNRNSQEYLGYVFLLERIVESKCKEFEILSKNLKKDGEELPKDMETKLGLYQNLISAIKALRAQQLELKNREYQRQRAEQLKQQELRKAQEATARIRQEQLLNMQYQRMMFPRMQQQQMRFNSQPGPPFHTRVPRAPNVYPVRTTAAGRPTVIQGSNVYQPNGHATGYNQNFGPKTYSRNVNNNVTVTRGPIVTEVLDDQPTSTTSASDQSTVTITEIID